MDRAALWVSIVAAAFAGLAAAFTAWGAWGSHRSARSAESSARSAESSARSTAEVVKLERDRRHHELTPRIELAYEGEIGRPQEEGVWFINMGPRDYTSVAFSFAHEDFDPPSLAST